MGCAASTTMSTRRHSDRFGHLPGGAVRSGQASTPDRMRDPMRRDPSVDETDLRQCGGHNVHRVPTRARLPWPPHAESGRVGPIPHSTSARGAPTPDATVPRGDQEMHERPSAPIQLPRKPFFDERDDHGAQTLERENSAPIHLHGQSTPAGPAARSPTERGSTPTLRRGTGDKVDGRRTAGGGSGGEPRPPRVERNPGSARHVSTCRRR